MDGGGGGEDATGRKVEVGRFGGGGEVWMQSKERRRGRGRCNRKEGRRDNERE